MTSDLVVQLFTHLIICAFEQKPNPETSQLFLSLYEPVKGIVKYPSENLMIIASKIFKVHRRFSSEISMKLDCELQFVNRIIKDKEPSLWATLIADHRPWDQFRNNLSSQLFTKFNEIVAKPPVITFFERILKQKKPSLPHRMMII